MNFTIDFCDTTPNPHKVEYDEQGFIIDKTQPTIDGSCFQSDCTVNFDGTHPSKATFYIGVDSEVGCFIQVGDMAINLDLGFTDLYGLKLFLDTLFAMPNESKELRLTSDEIRALLVKRDTEYTEIRSKK